MRHDEEEPKVDRGWLIENISYEDTIRLAASDLVDNYTRDVSKNSARFWPSSSGVLQHLKKNLPNNASVWGPNGFIYGKAKIGA